MSDEFLKKGDHGNPLHVYLVNPPTDDPWRTQGDYLEDRRLMEDSFRRTAEAHELLKKSHRHNFIILVLTFFIMAGTMISAFVMFSEHLNSLEAERQKSPADYNKDQNFNQLERKQYDGTR